MQQQGGQRQRSGQVGVSAGHATQVSCQADVLLGASAQEMLEGNCERHGRLCAPMKYGRVPPKMHSFERVGSADR